MIDAKEIGRELGVRYLLEGSVRRVGELITINAQLISTETGAHVWADRFDGERGKLGQLQVEVVSRLANSLGASSSRPKPAVDARTAQQPGLDLTSRCEVRPRSTETRTTRSSPFEQALALDPRNARR